MKKKTKANKQRLNNLLIVLLLSSMLLVMSTYAWFTANKTVNIDSIDVKVSTTSGLQISADGEDWKTVLDKTDLVKAKAGKYAEATNQLPKEMSPVSTVLNVNNNGRLDMFFGDVYADLNPDSPTYGEYVLESSLLTTDDQGNNMEMDGNNGKYIAFDVFLKSGNKAENLYMSGNVKELKYEGVDADDNPVYSYVENANSTGIANAARVGVIKGKNTTSTLGGDARALSTIGGKAFMWEPNSDTHTANGIANGVSLGWITPGSVAQVGAAPIAYAGLKAETAENSPVALSQITATGAPNLAQNITPTWTSKRDDLVNLPFPDTAKEGGYALNNGVTKFRIYMWVEGQDIDAENFASGSYLEYNLSFSLDPYRAAQGG